MKIQRPERTSSLIAWYFMYNAFPKIFQIQYRTFSIINAAGIKHYEQKLNMLIQKETCKLGIYQAIDKTSHRYQYDNVVLLHVRS